MISGAISYRLDDDDANVWVVNVVGGIGLLLSFCLQSVWYGFTRYPTVLEKDFTAWLIGGNTSRKEFEEIRDVCSGYFHGDDSRRSQTSSVLFCVPFLVIDQVAASTNMLLLSLVTYPIKRTGVFSQKTELFFQGVAKSIGAVTAAVAYYTIWMLGGQSLKIGTIVALLVNQALYTSILFRMGLVEFLCLQLFRGVVSVSFRDLNDSLPGKIATATDDRKCTDEIPEEELNTSIESDLSTEAASVDERSKQYSKAVIARHIGRGVSSTVNARDASRNFSKSVDTDIGNELVFRDFDSKRNDLMKVHLSPSVDGSSMNGHGRRNRKKRLLSSDGGKGNIVVQLSQEIIEDRNANFEIVPTSDRWIVKQKLALPGSRGPKTIDFTGEVHSAHIEADDDDDDDDDDETVKVNSGTVEMEQSSLPVIIQNITQKINMGFLAGMRNSGSSPKSWETTNGLVRSSTLSIDLSGGPNSLESKTSSEKPTKEEKPIIPLRDSFNQHRIERIHDNLTVSIVNDDHTGLHDSGIHNAVAIFEASRSPANKIFATPMRVDITEAITIVGEVESKRRHQTDEYNDIHISNDTQSGDQSTAGKLLGEHGATPVMDTVSVRPSSLNEGNTTRGDFVPTTSPPGEKDKEVPAPAYATSIENASRQSILDRHSLSVVNESTHESLNTMAALKGSTASRSSNGLPQKEQRVRQKIEEIDRTSSIPSQVDMLAGVGSIDEEDVTLVGFDSAIACTNSLPRVGSREGTPLPKVVRGRRPAPGRLDLSPEASSRDPYVSSMSTLRCDQFVYFDAQPNAK